MRAWAVGYGARTLILRSSDVLVTVSNAGSVTTFGDYPLMSEGAYKMRVAEARGRRYAAISPKPSKRPCMDGCSNPRTHSGRVNGVTLMTGCHFHVRMWVKDPDNLALFGADFQRKIQQMQTDPSLLAKRTS